MRKLLATLLLLPLSAMAATISWTPPNTRTDGQPLDPATELAEYRLYCADVVTPIQASTAGGIYETTKAEILPGYGSWDCHMTAVDLSGLESAPSGSVVVTWDPSAPMAPTNVLIILE